MSALVSDWRAPWEETAPSKMLPAVRNLLIGSTALELTYTAVVSTILTIFRSANFTQKNVEILAAMTLIVKLLHLVLNWGLHLKNRNDTGVAVARFFVVFFECAMGRLLFAEAPMEMWAMIGASVAVNLVQLGLDILVYKKIQKTANSISPMIVA